MIVSMKTNTLLRFTKSRFCKLRSTSICPVQSIIFSQHDDVISLLLLCGLHEVYSHIMVSFLFIYLFVFESRAPATWSSVYGELVVLVVSLGSSDFFQVIASRVSSAAIDPGTSQQTQTQLVL